MGVCYSTPAMEGPATAKVILRDGTLREYTYPTRVFEVLRKEPEEAFLCNADEMEFEGAPAEVAPEEALQEGQIYFVLPKKMRRRRLTAEDMAALAVRASKALAVSGEIRGVVPAPCRRAATVAPVGSAGGRKKVGNKRVFAPDLTAIEE